MINNVSKKDKVILAALGIIFLSVLLGMLWDLYAKEIYIKYISEIKTSQTESASSAPSGTTELNPTTKKQQNETNATKPSVNQNTKISYTSYSQCLENTKDDRSCKDCCDCLGTDASTVKACRDACPTYDYSKNTIYKEFPVVSKLGPNGDYSTCTASGNEQECKKCCDGPGNFACGDTKYCRTACNNLSK